MKLVDYYDENSGKTIEIPQVEDQTPESLLENCSGTINAAIANALFQLSENKPMTKIPAFMVGEAVFNIDRNHLNEVYQNCLTYYQNKEDFEMCSTLVKIAKKLEINDN